MEVNKQSATGLPLLLAVASFIIVIAGMKAAVNIVVPFLLSMFLAIIGAPPLFWLERRGFPRWLALLTVVLVIAGVISVFSITVASTIGGFSTNLPAYQERLQQLVAGLFAWLTGIGINLPHDELLPYLNPAAAMRLIGEVLNGFGKVLTNAFLIFLTTVFMLLEASGFPAKLKVATGDPEHALDRFALVTANINEYLAIKTLTSLATGIAIALWLTLLGIDYPVFWGMLAFMLNYVPSIGSIIAAIPAILLALVQTDVSTAALVAGGFLVVNISIGSIIEPRVMGRGLGVSTLVVFLSLIFWGWVLGPMGMFLSVPLTITFKIALESHERTRWIAVLLGPDVLKKGMVMATGNPGSNRKALAGSPLQREVQSNDDMV